MDRGIFDYEVSGSRLSMGLVKLLHTIVARSTGRGVGLAMLQEAGGQDLGFAFVIQDENVAQLVRTYELARSMGFELATSTLHNAWQFYKNDNYFYERVTVARQVEGLITAMLKSNKPKNWFRAYLNLGLIEKILGHPRLIRCSAGTDFAFIDPWSDVWACNVRSDLPLGNLARQSWSEIMCGEFGCFGDFASRTGAALSDRVMWLQTVRQAVEDNGFGWCVHDLDESFRITNDDGTFVPELLAALGLRKP